MKTVWFIIAFSVSLILSSCVSQFIPEINENREMLVVEGMITDQPEVNTIKLYKSLPLGDKMDAVPASGYRVVITDDEFNYYELEEIYTFGGGGGTYVTDPEKFCGVAGKTYTLNINGRWGVDYNSYRSLPVKMLPAPPIDTLIYEKKTILEIPERDVLHEGCQIYLSTVDPENSCKYYKWDFTETWEFHLPYNVPNKVCWISDNSGTIALKNTSVLSESRVTRFPINFISNETDRLKVRYSILVNQYSLNYEEFVYWEKIKSLSDNTGSLYDITPASIANNLYCVNDPNEKVLGYFSVAGKSSKRMFVNDEFSGIVDLYNECPVDTVYGYGEIDRLGTSFWVIETDMIGMLQFRVLTDNINCADCTVRGTNVKPDYW